MKLLLKIALAVVMLASATAASAKDFYYATRSATARYFVELDTRRDMGNGLYTAWVFTVYTGAGIKEGIKADQFLQYHDCIRHLYDLRANEKYRWDGTQLRLADKGSLPAYEPFDYSAVNPGTLIDDIHRAVCGPRQPDLILSFDSLNALVAAVDRLQN